MEEVVVEEEKVVSQPPNRDNKSQDYSQRRGRGRGKDGDKIKESMTNRMLNVILGM